MVIEQMEKLTALNQQEFRSRVEAVLDSAESFELDLRKCSLMDSAGVACLVTLHRKLKKTGKPFALLVSSGQVEETLVLTKLNRLYEVRLS